MTDLIKCDRCGEHVSGADSGMILVRHPGGKPVIGSIRMSGDVYFDDMCRECYEDFVQWWDEECGEDSE